MFKTNPVLLENVLDKAGEIIDSIKSEPLRIYLFNVLREELSPHWCLCCVGRGMGCGGRLVNRRARCCFHRLHFFVLGGLRGKLGLLLQGCLANIFLKTN